VNSAGGQFVIGHRGAAGIAPENTLKSFRLGLESPAAAVECDIRLTKDGKLVAFHDGTLERTTNGKGRVSDYGLEELKKLNAGGGEKIPEISEVANLVKNYGKILVIEIKAENDIFAEETSEVLCDIIRARPLFPEFQFCSFLPSAVKKLKKKFPSRRSALNFKGAAAPDKILGMLGETGASAAGVECLFATVTLVEILRENAFGLNVWTANDENTFRKMVSIGAGGIFTDFPGKFSL